MKPFTTERTPPATRLIASVAVMIAGLGATSAPAQDLSDKRMFPENIILNPNSDGMPYLYGQINKGFLVHSDGNDTNFFPLVDNDNTNTRAGIIYEDRWWSNVTVFANFEIAWDPYASDSVNQLNKDDVDWETNDIRHAEGSIAVDGFGRFWFGHGSSASDGSAEYDLSGTTIVAYSSITDTAGGQFFAFDGAPGLSGVKIGSAFSNLDGESRKFRLRYDTPTWNGIGLASSVGYDALSGDESEDLYWDIAAKFSRNEKDESLSYAAGAAFARSPTEDNRFSSSVSVLHKPSALSLTVAGGFEDRNTGPRNPAFGYVKLGYAPNLTQLGPTAFSVDIFRGGDFSTDGSDSLSVGGAAVQTIKLADVSFDIYTLVRWYQYDDAAASYQDGFSSLTGVRWKF